MNSKQKREKLVKKLADKEYRHAWAQESIKMALPFQIQTNREVRDWSQGELGERSGMLRNAVSRLESVEYGNLTINTLLRLAYGFDIGLLVKFVPFSRLVREFEDVSHNALEVESFDLDLAKLQQWPLALDDTFLSSSTTDLEDRYDDLFATGHQDVRFYVSSETKELGSVG